jgi:class 3 adenylate cyclase
MSASGGASRRTVTALFCDVVDSTALGERLDAEKLRRVQTDYFEAVREVLERHGGTVEKFIGDAVMAVFGLPVLHEDDALRALRAASELRVAIAPLDQQLVDEHELRWRIRVGVATGEVVAGDSTDAQSFATGGTVVVAQRLQISARPSEVLLDDATYRLAAGAAIVEPIDPVDAKGKAEPVAAWRLIGVQWGVPGVPRRLDTPLVGRRDELARLREAYDQAVSERRCRLVSVIGPAGIGKSRLVREFLARMAPEATIRVGRCPPYGEGITFWPLRELILQAIGDRGRRASPSCWQGRTMRRWPPRRSRARSGCEMNPGREGSCSRRCGGCWRRSPGASPSLSSWTTLTGLSPRSSTWSTISPSGSRPRCCSSVSLDQSWWTCGQRGGLGVGRRGLACPGTTGPG